MKDWLKKYQLYWKTGLLMGYDVCSVLLSGFLALWIKFDFRLEEIDVRFEETVWQYLPYNILVTLLLFWVFRLYHSLWSYAGIVELEGIFAACFLSGVVQLGYIHFLRQEEGQYPLPRSYYVLYGICLFAMTAGIRFLYRMLRQWLRGFLSLGARHRVMVVGAGETGHMMVREIRDSRHIRMKVCCVIDDDPQKRGSHVYGAPVVGTRREIPSAARRYRIHEILVAIPSAERESVQEVLALCRETGCQIKLLPGMSEIINGQVALKRLRDVSVEELLAKEPVETDRHSVRASLEGKTVLVTGGGGFVGSELCRQIAACLPACLVIVDIYENNAYDIQQELQAAYPKLRLEVLIASVRSRRQLEEICKKYRPELVYHAAAYKQAALMEESPEEAVKNNVFGAWRVLQAAEEYGAEKCILISTDRAVEPSSVAGATMRLCERLVQAQEGRTVFAAVRFGGVLAERGNLVSRFKSQIAEGGPVVVSHPDSLRYFMTLQEAVSLVLQAGLYARGGEVFELDMGEPVREMELAGNLIRLSGLTVGEDIGIAFSGKEPREWIESPEQTAKRKKSWKETKNRRIGIAESRNGDQEKLWKELRELGDFLERKPQAEQIKRRLAELAAEQ